MDLLTVVKPSFALEDSFLKMCEDYGKNSESDYAYRTIDEVRRKIASDQNYESGTIPQGRLQSYTYWFVSSQEIVGTSRLRPRLNERFSRVGGNVGYDVRPSSRRQGIGTEILRLTVLEAISIGMERLLITCDSENTASVLVIERNNGALLDIHFDPVSGKEVRRYNLELQGLFGKTRIHGTTDACIRDFNDI